MFKTVVIFHILHSEKEFVIKWIYLEEGSCTTSMNDATTPGQTFCSEYIGGVR